MWKCLGSRARCVVVCNLSLTMYPYPQQGAISTVTPYVTCSAMASSLCKCIFFFFYLASLSTLSINKTADVWFQPFPTCFWATCLLGQAVRCVADYPVCHVSEFIVPKIDCPSYWGFSRFRLDPGAWLLWPINMISYQVERCRTFLTICVSRCIFCTLSGIIKHHLSTISSSI